MKVDQWVEDSVKMKVHKQVYVMVAMWAFSKDLQKVELMVVWRLEN